MILQTKLLWFEILFRCANNKDKFKRWTFMTAIYLRRGQTRDLDLIMQIIDQAKAFLKSYGSPQWQDGHPNRQVLMSDIARQDNWVLMVGKQVAGTATLQLTPEPSYQIIHQGQWAQPNAPYATIHRLAISSDFRGQHLSKFMFSNLLTIGQMQGMKNFRLDTHKLNKPVQHLATDFGFVQRGIVTVQDKIDTQRLGYELNLGSDNKLHRINNDFMQGLIH